MEKGDVTGKYRVRHDRLLFLDFEMTCWEKGCKPPDEASEIVEIGIVDVDAVNLQVVRSESFLVKPELSSVSPYFTELTGITAALLKKHGRPLGEVLNTLQKKWGVANKAWMAWGRDRQALDMDCAAKSLSNPFSAQYFDYGLWHSLAHGAGRAVSLKAAGRSMGLVHTGTPHRGESDAMLTAQCWLDEAARARLLEPPDVWENIPPHVPLR